MDAKGLADLMVLINQYSGIPGIVFFALFVSFRNSNAKIVFFVLLASFLADLAITFYVEYVYPNSYGIATIWFVVDYFLLSWLFLKLTPSKKKIILSLMTIFIVGGIVSAGFFYSFSESNTFISSYPSAVFSFLSILAFLEILKEEPANRLIRYPVFWIVTGIFLFNSVTLIKNLFQQYLVFDLNVTLDQFIIIYLFSLTFNIIKNLFFLYAFVLVRKGQPDYIISPKPATT